MSSKFETILVLDFGSQYTQLIGRRIREANVYSEIVPFNTSARDDPEACSRRESFCPAVRTPSTSRARRLCDPGIFELGIPILGVCYGMQLMAKELGGKVEPAAHREYGSREIETVGILVLLDGMRRVWMSHGDRILEPPPGFRVTARSDTAMAAMENPSAEDLRHSIPSRSHAHRERQSAAAAIHLRYLRMQRRLDDRLVHRTRHRADPGAGRRRPGASAPSAAAWTRRWPQRWCRARSATG